MPPTTPHRWRFTRAGGFDQARIDSAADLAHIEELDQKLWAALACPVRGLEMDERTLALVDTDNDGRIRAPEVIAAVRWLREHLADLASAERRTDAVPLAAISRETPGGRAVLASATRILRDLGRADATEVTLADVADTAKVFAAARLNGDGVVPAEAADDPAVRGVLAEMIACLGGLPERSGKPGIDGAGVERFFNEAHAFVEWAAKPAADPTLLPAGAATAAAADAVRAVRAKVDDWFVRCRVAAFDARAAAPLNRGEPEYAAFAGQTLATDSPDIAALPLARVEAGATLPLEAGVNPAWRVPLARLRRDAAAPLLGGDRTALDEASWEAMKERLGPHEAWHAGKPETPVERLGLPRLREILAGDLRARVEALIRDDLALEPEFRAMADVERLVRYHRDLLPLLRNFVNLLDFYGRERPAVFQAGRLYLDGRACDLCIRVGDPGRHAALAGLSKAFLAYCDCTRASGERMAVVAAFTAGETDFLMVGRNGVFYDRQGRDWDATVTRVVENPISVRQAFWAPYKKLVRFIEERVAKRAAAGEAASDARLAEAADAAAEADRTPAPPAAAAAPAKRIDVGTVAALGVAVGAIGTMLAAFAGYAASALVLPFWKICLAAAALLLLVSGPSMLIAWLKLRQRSLAPLLDANGWAVNGRVRLSVPFGAALTSVAALPAGSAPASPDAHRERRSPWPRVLLVVVVLGFAWSFAEDQGWTAPLREWVVRQWGTPETDSSGGGVPEKR